MDIYEYLLKVSISLVVVIAVIVLLLPVALRRFSGIKGLSGKGSFEVKKVSPIAKNVLIVELSIKGNTYVLCVSEKGADVIYREDDKGSASSSGGSKPADSPGADNTTG